MNAIVTTRPPVRNVGALRTDPRRLALFSTTVGKELKGYEIDLAVQYCEIFNADPFTNGIYFFVFGKYGTAGRRITPVLSIHQYRRIAAASNTYRPDPAPPRFTYDEKLKGLTNPKGIVDCEVVVYRYAHGEWHPITSRLRWEERAPIIKTCEGGYEWKGTGEHWENEDGSKGKEKKVKVPKGVETELLDPKKESWHKMPETMLAKCTEADALRKGWPNETQGAYAEGELDAVKTIDLTADDIIREEEVRQRLERIGGASGKTIYLDWMDGSALQILQAGQVYDEVMKWIRSKTKPGEEEYSTILSFFEKNRMSLQQYWGIEKDAANELKKEMERIKELAAAPAKD